MTCRERNNWAHAVATLSVVCGPAESALHGGPLETQNPGPI